MTRNSFCNSVLEAFYHSLLEVHEIQLSSGGCDGQISVIYEDRMASVGVRHMIRLKITVCAETMRMAYHLHSVQGQIPIFSQTISYGLTRSRQLP